LFCKNEVIPVGLFK
jgi:hypothetical protein